MEKAMYKEVLLKLGLSEQQVNNISEDVNLANGNCTVQNLFYNNGDILQLLFHFREYEALEYSIKLKSISDIPNSIMHGINVKELDYRMQLIDWNTSKADIALEQYFLSVNPEIGQEEIRTVIKDVFKLTEKDVEAQQIAERLMAKHWLETSFRSNFPNYLDHLRDKIEKSCTVPISYGVSISEAKSVLLNGSTVKSMTINGKLVKCELSISKEGEMQLRTQPFKVKSIGQGLSI
ncbi:VIT1/CCC1 transporter family protein [Chitinophaga rhizophila]|uniref:Uncharacterized protein n=1 Tax=Chitinophaga rhizophila TaxID=2866212 RepID=A0ABS7G711_9BACT|nr:hypothetical protein [Chitinophaga rhizophila]MBW8683441.1 hypothetical protein [Chitinophaga rhizophila]